MLARYAQAFLCVGRPRILARSVAQKDVLELVHARIGEHQRRIALDHHRGRGNDLVSLAPEKVQKGLANFIRFHIYCFIRFLRLLLSGCKITQFNLNLRVPAEFFQAWQKKTPIQSADPYLRSYHGSVPAAYLPPAAQNTLSDSSSSRWPTSRCCSGVSEVDL